MEDLSCLISQFPAVEFAFSYGSGIIQQAGYNYNETDLSKLPMYDFIFAVEDPVEVVYQELISDQ